MAHEISQFDIADRQMLFKNIPSRSVTLIDIGQAIITRTIFGGAKVRVIRKQDRIRRLWLLTTLLATLVAASSWHWWITLQQNINNPPEPLPLSATIRVSAPTFQPEFIPIAINPRTVGTSTKTPTEILLNNLNTTRTPRPQQPVGLNPSGQTDTVSLPPKTSAINPQGGALTASNIAPKNQIEIQEPIKTPATAQPPIMSSPLHASSQTPEIHSAEIVESVPAAQPPSTVTPLPTKTTSVALPADAKPPVPVSAQSQLGTTQ